MTDSSSADVSQPVEPGKPFTPQRRHLMWAAAVVVGLFLLLLGHNLFVDVPLIISKKTTYITEPLTPDGTRVDYFAAMEQLKYPPEMQTDDNGCRMIVRELGVSKDLTPKQRQAVYEKLGLDPLIPPTLTLEDSYDYLKRYAKAHPSGPDADKLQLKTWEPWTLEDCPEMADWLTQNEAAIDLIGKALRQPTFCMPLCPNDDGSTTLYPLNQNSSVLRVYARALQERANYWVAIGEADKAIDDAISIRRLGRLISHNGTLIEHLAGITFSGMSVGVPIAGSLERQPSEAQLRRFLDETNNLPPNPKFVDAVFWEQSSFCDYLQRVALARELDLTELGAEVPWSHLPLSHDWNIVAEEASTVFEDARRGTTTPIVPVTAAVLFRRTRSQEVANKLRASYGNMFTAVREAFHRMDCQDNLLRIVLAMLLYEKQHGTLPPEFSADAQGKPLHSWRVLLLPFLGEQELFEKIRLDEPWDSPHNQKFHAEEVAVFQCPSEHGGPGETTCTVISGATTAFHGSVGKRLDSFGPKSVNMILVAERKTPVCWMAPTQEVPFADALMGINRHSGRLPSGGLGSPHPGGMHVALRSASVTFLSENIDPAVLQDYLEGNYEPEY